MNLKIVVAILVICASSQISAKLIEDKEVAERIVQVAEDMFHIIERIKNSFVMDRERHTTDKFTKHMYTLFTSSRQKLLDTIINKLGNCTNEPKEVISNHSIGLLKFPKIGQVTHKELWNYVILPHNFLATLISKQLKESEAYFEIEMLFTNFLQNLANKHLKDIGNRIWYIILLVNLLNIKCHPKDNTLRYLWRRIPQPSTVPEFGDFTLKELWDNQELPPLFLSKPKELTSFLKCETDTVKEVWDKIHYQLLFYRVWQIKFQSNDGILERWNEIIPLHVFKHRNDTAIDLWDELTQPTVVPESTNDTIEILWNKLYSPLQSKIGSNFLWFTKFDSFEKSMHQNLEKYKRKQYIGSYSRFKPYFMDHFEEDDFEEEEYMIYSTIRIPLRPVKKFEED